MLDKALIEQLNRGYVCPPDAGPAWRAAHEAGHDMSLIELNLGLTPWERLLEHDDVLAFHDELREAGRKLHAQT
jgi:hypothetical protein